MMANMRVAEDRRGDMAASSMPSISAAGDTTSSSTATTKTSSSLSSPSSSAGPSSSARAHRGDPDGTYRFQDRMDNDGVDHEPS
jgi:hypothetical protein